VIVPYRGDDEGARAAARQLQGLRTRPGDVLLLADNTPDATAAAALAGFPAVSVLDASASEGPYFARNLAARDAATEWLLFTDADCLLDEDLLDRYFDLEIADDVGALAGTIEGEVGQPGFMPAYIRSRRHLDHAVGMTHPFRPQVFTANLLVRTAAFRAVGGFAEGVLSGADIDFGWRLVGAGWRIELREGARVQHHHRETLRAFLSQTLRDGAGEAWIQQRHPSTGHGPGRLRGIGRALLGSVVWLVALQPRRAVYKAIDGIYIVAEFLGSRRENRAKPAP
jgi:GT2 family glycosyltransferase